jgi:hypothetical protein
MLRRVLARALRTAADLRTTAGRIGDDGRSAKHTVPA